MQKQVADIGAWARVSVQQPQIILLKEGTDTSQGKMQLISNINACMAVVDTVRTTLGPRGMDKLIYNDKVGTRGTWLRPPRPPRRAHIPADTCRRSPTGYTKQDGAAICACAAGASDHFKRRCYDHEVARDCPPSSQDVGRRLTRTRCRGKQQRCRAPQARR